MTLIMDKPEPRCPAPIEPMDRAELRSTCSRPTGQAATRLDASRIDQAQGIEALPFRPFINWRALGWCLVTLLVCGFLLGLLAVGAR